MKEQQNSVESDWERCLNPTKSEKGRNMERINLPCGDVVPGMYGGRGKIHEDMQQYTRGVGDEGGGMEDEFETWSGLEFASGSDQACTR